MRISRCSLNSATVPQLDFPGLLKAAATASIPAVAPWRDIVQAFGPRKAKQALADAELKVSSLCRGGMFTSESAAERKKADDDNLRAIDEAHELGSELLAIVCGPTVNKDLSGSRAMVRDGLEKILNHAQGAGVHLGIEPLHPMLAADRSVVTSLRDANALRLEIDHPNLGIVVDSYNVWFDPELEDLLTAIGPGLLGFQLADWILPITDPTANRGMIGDGYIDFGRVIAAMDAAGYRGLIEVEILSHHWRRQPAGDVVRLVADRFTALAETKTTTSETHARRHLTG